MRCDTRWERMTPPVYHDRVAWRKVSETLVLIRRKAETIRWRVRLSVSIHAFRDQSRQEQL